MEFGKSPQLIKVPSCGDCNWGSREDDDYFRNVVAMMAMRKETHQAPDVLAAMARAVGHANAIGRTAPLLPMIRAARPTYAVLGSSGILKPAMAAPVNWGRVRRVADRIFRGLYWHETGRRLAVDAELDVIGDIERDRGDFQAAQAFGDLALCAVKGTVRHVHPTKFSYAHVAADDGVTSVWLLAFYREVLFLGIVSGLPESSRVART